jgi:hypothetical protein
MQSLAPLFFTLFQTPQTVFMSLWKRGRAEELQFPLPVIPLNKYAITHSKAEKYNEISVEKIQ